MTTILYGASPPPDDAPRAYTTNGAGADYSPHTSRASKRRRAVVGNVARCASRIDGDSNIIDDSSVIDDNGKLDEERDEETTKAASPATPPELDWRTLLVGEERRARASQPRTIAALPGDLVYVVEVDKTRRTGELTIALRARALKKDGGLTKDRAASVAMQRPRTPPRPARQAGAAAPASGGCDGEPNLPQP